jgi:hypothetical protein
LLAIFENPVTGSVEFSYVSMHDSLSGEWYQLEVKDASSSRTLEGLLYEGLREAGYGDVRPAHYAVFRYLKDKGSRVTELAEARG